MIAHRDGPAFPGGKLFRPDSATSGSRVATSDCLLSEMEFQAELENPRVVACGDDASEVAWIDHLSRGRVNFTARSKQGIQIADRIRKVRVIQKVERLSAKLEAARFGHGEHLGKNQIQINLSRPAQTVPANVANVCAHGTEAGSRRRVRT